MTWKGQLYNSKCSNYMMSKTTSENYLITTRFDIV